MATKKTATLTLSSLIGKKVMVLSKYADVAEGPYILMGVDAGYIGLGKDDKIFWWNHDYLMTIREYEEETPIAK